MTQHTNDQDTPSANPEQDASDAETTAPVPPLLTKHLREQLAQSGNLRLQYVAQDKDMQAQIEALENDKATTVAAILRRKWRTGKFVKSVWHPGTNVALSYDEPARVLGGSREDARLCATLYSVCTEAQLEELIAVGMTWPIVAVLLLIDDMKLRSVKFQEVTEGKITPEQLRDFVRRHLEQIDRDKRKAKVAAAKVPSPQRFDKAALHRAADMVRFCNETRNPLDRLHGHLTKTVDTMGRVRGCLSCVSFEQRIEAIREVTAGFEALYATQRITACYLSQFAERMPAPPPEQMVVPPPSTPPYGTLPRLWNYLLLELPPYGQSKTDKPGGTGIKALAQAGKGIQRTCLAILEQVRRLDEILTATGELPAEVPRDQVYSALRSACRLLSRLPLMMDAGIKAILPKELD